MFASCDAERQLTSSGKAKVIRQAETHQNVLSSVDIILHSPYIRACQTAELVAEKLGVSARVELQEWIPEGSPAEALRTLETYTENTPLVVTHMPLVSYVEALCCQGNTSFPASFSCAEISQIEADWPAAELGFLAGRYY